MNNLLKGSLSSMEVPTKSKDNLLELTNPLQSKRIKKIFDVDEELETKENKPEKVLYNEKIYFKPQTNSNSNHEDMKKVINVIKNQTKDIKIEQEGKNIYQVNLNINNNYYGSNFNINYPPDKERNSNSTRDLEDTIKTVKSVPCKVGVGVGGGELTEREKKLIKQQLASTTNNIGCSSTKSTIKKSQSKTNQLSVPCINCGNLIDIDEIEDHSNSCLKVKEEVLEVSRRNSNIKDINNKLSKLDECLSKNKINENKDAHYYVSLSEYLNTVSGNNSYNN